MHKTVSHKYLLPFLSCTLSSFHHHYLSALKSHKNPPKMSNKEDPIHYTTNPSTSSSSSPIPFPNTPIDTQTPTTTTTTTNIGSASGGSSSFQSSDNILYDNSSSSNSNNNNAEAEFGVFRPDFRQNVLVGSVQYYERHVFLCYKNPRNWPPRIEAAEFDRLPRLLSAALSNRKSDLNLQTRLTICEGRDGTETSNGDVLIFPDMIRYRRLTHFDIDTFVEEVLIKGGEWLPGNPEKLKGSYVFVCCHGSRDRRCGVCGPPLVARFKDEVEVHGLQGEVSVSPCSHVGGHKYAGNVIIFGSSINGELSGHWYGYVTLDDVPTLLQQHILKGEIVEPLWRGQMGLSEDDQQIAQELRLRMSKGANTGRTVRQNPEKLPDTSAPTCEPRAVSNGCHQANGNGTCCQVAEDDKFDTIGGEIKASAGMKGKKQLSRNNSYKGVGKRKVCSMPSWFESWECDDTYAALAVVCAAVSVGVAYSCYKQL